MPQKLASNAYPPFLILRCPECGEGDVRWCGISVRPHCADCGTWAPVNLGSADAAVADWNRRLEMADAREQAATDKEIADFDARTQDYHEWRNRD